jgi:arabinofuranosyltransferase
MLSPGLRRTPVLFCLTLLAAFVAGAWQRAWLAEDAFICLRTADMVALGWGPVFNPGERVEACTSPLWLAWIVLGRVLLGDAQAWTLGSGGLASVAALAVALAAGRPAPGQPPALPLFWIAFALLPPAWDFATSGLEQGMALLHAAISAWLFLRAGPRVARSARVRLAIAAWWGVGPLIRPELGILLPVGAVWMASRIPADQRRRLPALAALPALVAALPLLLLTIARAAFFGVLVPNTAIAKAAAAADWWQGLRYLGQLVEVEHLAWVLVAALLTAVARAFALRDVAGVRALQAVVLLWTLYVVRLGGDFMHGRMLLTPLLLLLAAHGWVRMPPAAAPRALVALAAGLLVFWPVDRLLRHTPPAFEERPAVDERAQYVAWTGSRRLTRADDYGGWHFHALGAWLGAAAPEVRALHGPRPMHVDLQSEPQRLTPAPTWVPGSVALVASADCIGVASFVAGAEVFVIDNLGLADAFAARQDPVEGRVGHRRRLTPALERARFAPRWEGDAVWNAEVAGWRRALQCGELLDLHLAITAPLDAARLLRNLSGAVARTRLQIPRRAAEAEARFCGGAVSAASAE